MQPGLLHAKYDMSCADRFPVALRFSCGLHFSTIYRKMLTPPFILLRDAYYGRSKITFLASLRR